MGMQRSGRLRYLLVNNYFWFPCNYADMLKFLMSHCLTFTRIVSGDWTRVHSVTAASYGCRL